jgi:hypothetical protein
MDMGILGHEQQCSRFARLAMNEEKKAMSIFQSLLGEG